LDVVDEPPCFVRAALVAADVDVEGDAVYAAAVARGEEVVEVVEGVRVLAVAAAVVDGGRDEREPARVGDLLDVGPERCGLRRGEVRLLAEVRLVEAEQRRRAFRDARRDGVYVEGAAP